VCVQALQYLQKSHRCATQAVNWEKEVEKCKEVAKQSVSIAKGTATPELVYIIHEFETTHGFLMVNMYKHSVD
jgi:hypothetical protein